MPLATALAVGFASTRLGLLAAAGLCAVFLVADIAVFDQPNLQRDDWRSAALAVTATPGRAAIAVYPAWDTEPLNYYAPHLVSLTRSTPVRSLWLIGVASQFSGWNPPATISIRAPAGFRLATRTVLQHFVLWHYTSPTPTDIDPAQVARLIIGANGENIPHAQALLQP